MIKNNMISRWLAPFAFVIGLAGLLAIPATSSAASTNTVAFLLDIGGSANSPTITFTSQSRAPITSFKLDIRNGASHWDGSYRWLAAGPPDGGVTTFFTPATSVDRTASLEVRFDSLSFGQSVTVVVDIDPNYYNAVVDYRNILFNNGGSLANNALLTVQTQAGGTPATLVLPDQADPTAGSFRFESVNRPLDLTVRSVLFKGVASTNDPEAIPVGNVNVLIDGVSGFYFDNNVPRPTTNISKQVVIPVFAGEEVLITAPETVYWDDSNKNITELVLNDASKIEKAQQRFIARGFSVNNQSQTGDSTRYLFNMAAITKVDVRWLHDYALTITHDFDATLVRDASGAAYAGPLTSYSMGDPSPEAKKQWIPEGQSVLPSIAGSYTEPNNDGLDIRYVPIGYWGTGPLLNGSSISNYFETGSDGTYSQEVGFAAFNVGQAPPLRQTVPEFVMNSPARLTYVWQVELGVRVNADNPTLPRVYRDDFQIGSGQGLFWVDPGSKVFVGSKANVVEWPSAALVSWINGDGYYFSGQGSIDSYAGSLITGGPSIEAGTPVANWVPGFTNAVGGIYRGLEIGNIRRPVRVMFQYGDQVIRDEVSIGEHVFQSLDKAWLASRFTYPPEIVTKISVSGSNQNVSDAEMTAWDDDAKRLYPLVPGEIEALWTDRLTGYKVRAMIRSVYPVVAHYPHIADTPAVALDPDSADSIAFLQIPYAENDASAPNGLFSATTEGHAVLTFSETRSSGRGAPRHFLRVRVVETKRWQNVVSPTKTAIIGRKITDSELDLAKLGTGFLRFETARYNPDIYDVSKLNGLASRSIYDINVMRQLAGLKVVTQPENLPGSIIPVNLHPGAPENQRIVVIWYDDPVNNDELLWPHAARKYLPQWPQNEAEGLGRIVIASRYGSESVSAVGSDQTVVGATSVLVVATSGAVATNTLTMEKTYNPSRLQQVRIYQQDDSTKAGYNPNEEHALLAPSLRYATASPRPPAAYALRDNDLNVVAAGKAGEVDQPSGYTSHPYVMVEFYDAALGEYQMRVYSVVKEDAARGYAFANQTLVKIPDRSTSVAASPLALSAEAHVDMEAGEPVIAFYPLPVAIGASPCPDTFGINIKNQTAYWEDHKDTSWAISGGSDAWFTMSTYYPLAPDFWWPAGQPGYVRKDSSGTIVARVPAAGDSIAFLPVDLKSLRNLAANAAVSVAVQESAKPTKILYKSNWPELAPTLKAGETLTFSGGEYRADHATTVVVNDQGAASTVETPGLPGVLAFSTAEVVFDSLNPSGTSSNWTKGWTARVAPALEQRVVPLALGQYPPELSPASGRTRVSQGKYVFNSLPASLQKRVRYNPLAQSVDPTNGLTITGQLEIFGLLNDKNIGDATLTASPPAVYVLEPNILTSDDKKALQDLDNGTDSVWDKTINKLYSLTRNPGRLQNGSSSVIDDQYLVGLEAQIVRDSITGLPTLEPVEPGSAVTQPVRNYKIPAPSRVYGPGLALIPNGDFLNPNGTIPGTASPYPDISWVSVVENNDANLGGLPITVHIIRVDRNDRYRGAVKTIESDNVFDENLVLRHTGDFGANGDDLIFEWWYRPDDGSLNVPPPDLQKQLTGQYDPWKLYPDPSGLAGKGRISAALKGNPSAPEALLADTWWFCRYRHINEVVSGVDWGLTRPVGDGSVAFTWAGAGNSDPFNDFDLNGVNDFKAQLAMGWIKRVLDAVNPYEARIRNFEGDNPATQVSIISQLGARYEGPVALNPSKNVIENVGLIELYETILNRASDLSINLSTPISTPAIANALQLVSTRISDFYTLLGNEAYGDALDPTIGFGSSSVEYGNLSPAVFAFQNQSSSLIEEELNLLRGVDENYARPVYNRLFWNFTKAEGEAAYVMNYNVSDITQDGFVNEDDAMRAYPQGHGDAWGHYLTALTHQYDLLKHPNFNWVSRSEYYNLQDIPIAVDFLDERKFAQIAAAKAKAGAEVVSLTYRDAFVEDPTAQWQGYTDANPDRAWGVQEWSRRTAQGAYFDWVVANALLPARHPNQNLEGIQKVDRSGNGDLAAISANMNAIQRVLDNANKGYNPLGIGRNAVPFDIDPLLLDNPWSANTVTHFEQVYSRAVEALNSAKAVWDNANESRNMVRRIGTTEAEFRNSTFQEDLSYKNRLIQIFGSPYAGTIGSGKLYPAGYEGPDTMLYMYVKVRQMNSQTVPGPGISYATFGSSGKLTGGDLFKAFNEVQGVTTGTRNLTLSLFDGAVVGMRNSPIPGYINTTTRALFSPTFVGSDASFLVSNGLYSVNYTDLSKPKVDLQNFSQLMPVTAAGYTFQAPSSWGSRTSPGELQSVISSMIQQEARIAEQLGVYDALMGQVVRTIRLANAKINTSDYLVRDEEFNKWAQFSVQTILDAITAVSAFKDAAKDTVVNIALTAEEVIPENLPTGGLAISPGDALAPARAAIKGAATTAGTAFSWANVALQVAKFAIQRIRQGISIDRETKNMRESQAIEALELYKEVEDLVGDEPKARVAIFKEIEALRQLSDHYQSLLAEGGRLVDERTAFNKRVAASVQLNRYQDMTFRVSRNHALQTYRSTFDLASRYTYLAARAYDFETNLDPADQGAPTTAYSDIVRSRTLGQIVSDTPRMGQGGLAETLAWLRANHGVLKSQLGINNPDFESSKLSLRRELYRIVPSGEVQPTNVVQFAGPGIDSDDLWKQTLQKARVSDLWEVPEFRYLCRPFTEETDSAGVHIAQPGLVLRFGTQIYAGKNFFGKSLSGGDHAFDPSLFSTKVRSAGVWFNNYLTDSITNDLPVAPRVYLLPAGQDVMRISSGVDSGKVRYWKVLDQRIPVPFPAASASLDQSKWIPLLDSLNGAYGEQRQFSSFRAYHNAGSDVNEDELVYSSRLIGRSIWNTEWLMIIPGITLNSDPDVGLDRFIDRITDINLLFQTYGYSGN